MPHLKNRKKIDDLTLDQGENIKNEVINNPDRYGTNPGTSIGFVVNKLNEPVGTIPNPAPQQTINLSPITWSGFVALVGAEIAGKIYNDVNGQMLRDVSVYPMIDLSNPGIQSILDNLVSMSAITAMEKTTINNHKTLLDPNYQKDLPGPSRAETVLGIPNIRLHGGDIRGLF